MRQLYHLLRVLYRTEDDSMDTSETAAMDSTWQIVDVDWSTPGYVAVTYRIPGALQ